MVIPLILVTGAIFLASLFDQRLFALLGNDPISVLLYGEYWRMVTYMFLHGGVMHLAFNMYAFLLLGSFVERVYGPIRLAVVYFVSGAVAGLSPMVYLYLGKLVMSIGASGGIMGIFGAILASPYRSFVLSKWNITAIILLNLYGLISNIDVVGHALGFVAGYVLGLAVMREDRWNGATPLGLPHAENGPRPVSAVPSIAAQAAPLYCWPNPRRSTSPHNGADAGLTRIAAPGIGLAPIGLHMRRSCVTGRPYA